MREFTVAVAGASLLGTQAMVFVNPKAAPNANIEFLRFWAGQSQNATSAQQRIEIDAQTTPFPTLTAATPAALKRAEASASIIIGSTSGAAGTAGVNSSTDGTTSYTNIWQDAFNVLNGWLLVPTPAETIVFPAGLAQGMNMRTPIAPATTTNWAAGVVYREV